MARRRRIRKERVLPPKGIRVPEDVADALADMGELVSEIAYKSYGDRELFMIWNRLAKLLNRASIDAEEIMLGHR